MHKGFLISIEGIDGSGKSTLARNLTHLLLEKKYDVLLTKQPGGTQLGAQLREILHENLNNIDNKAEFLLFAADRAQHFARVVLPALDQGKIVISDRMHDSSMAYQGFGRGLDKNMIALINQWAMSQRVPDLTIYVHIDVTTALERLNTTRNSLTRIEQERVDFWQRVTQGFQTMYEGQAHVLTVDGTEEPHVLAQQVFESVMAQYEKI